MAARTRKTTEVEETADKGLKEGFNLDDLLNGVKMTQREVTVHLDPTLASEAFNLNAEIRRLREEGSTEITTIADEPKERELQAILDKLNESALVFTIRALAAAEVTAIRNKVVATVKIPKNATSDERDEAQNERQEIAYEHFLSHAVISMKHGEAEQRGLSLEEAKKLRRQLPANEWAKLARNFDEVQVEAQAIEEVLSEPSFRWSVSDEA